jgi:hypothetical protein
MMIASPPPNRRCRCGAQALATAQRIYANQLQDLGVVDAIIFEKPDETYQVPIATPSMTLPPIFFSYRKYLSSSLINGSSAVSVSRTIVIISS